MHTHQHHIPDGSEISEINLTFLLENGRELFNINTVADITSCLSAFGRFLSPFIIDDGLAVPILRDVSNFHSHDSGNLCEVLHIHTPSSFGD